MALGEFDLIARYFQRPAAGKHAAVVLGIGDDCALLTPRSGMQLAVSCDMMVQGRHFFADTDPERLGHKALAVNLSDLAACGARPLACTLALALPEANEEWLSAFAGGLLQLADAHGCTLMGGDTTAGPLNICITVFGEVPVNTALLRSGACVGDDVWVSGTLGDAHLALRALQGHKMLPGKALALARQRLEAPTPRLALGQSLRGIASSAIDVSDGLLADLGHILAASAVGAEVRADRVAALLAVHALPANERPVLTTAEMRQCTLAGGDDYELVFTAAPAQCHAVAQAAAAAAICVTRIGHITATPGIRLVDAQGVTVEQAYAGFEHFSVNKP